MTRSEPESDVTGPTRRIQLLLRVELTDRPGALGLVASRIGALRADIVGIDVLERGDGVVVDEFAVEVDPDHLDLLVREVEEVDGAAVEEYRTVDTFPDPRTDALTSAERLCRCTNAFDVYRVLAEDVAAEFHTDWTAVVPDQGPAVHAGREPPPGAALRALAAPGAAEADGEVLVVAMPSGPATLVTRRRDHRFRRRERLQLVALAAVADRVVELLAATSTPG